MGFVITPKCKCLKEERTYFIGLGIQDFLKDYQNELAYCSACKSFDTVGESDICRCGSKMERIYTMDMLNNDAFNIKCPRCGDEMQISVTGMWD